MKILGKYEGKLFGGKIDNLNFLLKKGFNVPKGFCLNKIISKEEVTNLFYIYIKSKNYITRSSANCEDGSKLSYAGMFKSIEGFYEKGLLYDDIKEVFQSIENEYLDLYEKSIIGKKIKNRKMNVLIQEYIVGDISGVYLSNIDNKRVLSFISGGNKLLVDGKVNGTNIYMDENFKIIKQEYNIQEKILDGNFNIIEYNKKVILKNKLFLNLIKEFIKIERIYKYPVDIEWTVKKNKIYILQVRPITV